MSTRQTADLVALILAVVVAIVVIMTTAIVGINLLQDPEYDAGSAVDALGRIIGVLVGALVGYMAGRRINGKNGTDDHSK